MIEGGILKPSWLDFPKAWLKLNGLEGTKKNKYYAVIFATVLKDESYCKSTVSLAFCNNLAR